MSVHAPLVSIVIPTHNSADYIGEGLQSVFAQTYPNFEVLVVDDGSTDDTQKVVARFAADPRLRLLGSPIARGGPSAPRNEGVRAAAGDVIVLLDSDDLLAPRSLEWAVEALRDMPDVGAVFFNVDVLDVVTGRNLGPFLSEFDGFWNLARTSYPSGCSRIDDPRAYKQLIATNYVRPAGTAIPKRVFEAIGLFDETLTNADDWDLWLRISRRFPLGFVDRPGAIYRIRPGSVSGRRGVRLIANRLRVLERCRLEPADREVGRTLDAMLSLNHAYLAYDLRGESDFAAAWKHYGLSLRFKPNWPALKGWVVSGIARASHPRMTAGSIRQ